MSALRLAWGIMVLTLTAIVAADSLDALNNDNGQTPCCVTQQLLIPCQGSISRDCSSTLQETDVNPGSMCTCNTVVFNLWSACLEIRNKTAPMFDHWSSSCQANMTSITNSDYPLHNDVGGTHIPTWAYIRPREDSSFGLGAAVETTETTRWTTFQIVLPIIVGVSMLVTCLAIVLWYRRRTRRKYGMGSTTGGLFQSFSHGVRRQLGLRSSTQQAHSSNSGQSNPWTIDDFEPRQDGHIWLAPLPKSPAMHGFRRNVKFIGGFWRNPFKKRPVRVRSLQPQQGFRVDSIDLSIRAPGSGSEGHRNEAVNTDLDRWSVVNAEDAEESFDARDDGEDERSVLLISRAPGEDFSLASESHHPNVSSPTAGVNIIPPTRDNSVESPPEGAELSMAPESLRTPSPTTGVPSSQGSKANSRSNSPASDTNPHSFSRNPSVETLIRPARTDPVMLFPSSVRAAGYNGITNPYASHSWNASPETELVNDTSLAPLTMHLHDSQPGVSDDRHDASRM